MLGGGRTTSPTEKQTGGPRHGQRWAFEKATAQPFSGDSLLCYFHHARNAETHGLEASLRPAAPILENVHGAPSTKLLKDNEREVFVDVKNKQGQVAARLRVILSKTIKLVPVVDRGVTYGTPTEHLGQKLKSGSLAGLCALMISYLETLIDESSKL